MTCRDVCDNYPLMDVHQTFVSNASWNNLRSKGHRLQSQSIKLCKNYFLLGLLKRAEAHRARPCNMRWILTS